MVDKDTHADTTGGRRQRGARIRRFVLEHVDEYPSSIVGLTAERFGMSRQMAHKHVRKLIDDGLVEAAGRTKGFRYSAAALSEEYFTLAIVPGLSESDVWRERVAPLLSGLPGNVAAICEYGFTEILNNAIEHSGAKKARVRVRMDANRVRLGVFDQGIGIFEKLRRDRHIEDDQVAVYELLKGKMTTDPDSHSGQGIFFTSRAFDRFCILSGATYFSYSRTDHSRSIAVSRREPPAYGTSVVMEIRHDATTRLSEVFREFADADIDAFTRTQSVVRLAACEGEHFVSRSQARRLLSRFEEFRDVTLDFEGVEFIGQGFADEVFRVFPSAHPSVALHTVNTNDDVARMIRWVTARSAK